MCGLILSLNGIERINKQYYSGILNGYLKSEILGTEYVRKFSFPSYTTRTGKKLAAAIKKFKTNDMVKINESTRRRYVKIARLLMDNYNEYFRYIELHQTQHPKNVSIINNNYYSIIAHGLALSIDYYRLVNTMIGEQPFKNQNNVLAFFIVTNNVEKVLTDPPKSHEVYLENYINNDTISKDYINFYKQVNNFYRQIYITLSYSHKFNGRAVLIEVDSNDSSHIAKAVSQMKSEIAAILKSPNSIIPTINKK